MALASRLELRHAQSPAAMPQLRHSARLLRFSAAELAAHVEEEFEHNPLLERVRGAGGTGPEGTTGHGAGRHGTGTIEDRADRGISLNEHLAGQIRLEFGDRTEQRVATCLLGAIDAAGYLDPDASREVERLGCGADLFESVLARLHRLDPPGVFARSLEECLRLQLIDRYRLDPISETILGHLDLVEKRDFDGLRRLCGCTDQDLANVLAEFRTLDPRPGHRFDPDPVAAVVPDILVRPGRTGAWQVELNPETLPGIIANERYYADVRGSVRSRADRAFLSGQWRSARWLVGALERRGRTILRVAREIVHRQDMFMTRGVRHLRPLVLHDIARTLDLHESTVSRATTGKYMLTPRGMFELKYFFSPALGSAEGGDTHSAEAVRHRIHDLIDGEPRDTPLSDREIVHALERAGISVARRTVAKYRDTMHIPSSVRRRRQRGLAQDSAAAAQAATPATR